MQAQILEICYLIASVTFITGLKMMGHPASARRGNLLAAAGMGLAIGGTIFLFPSVIDRTPSALVYVLIVIALLLGTVTGYLTAHRVKMTAMPELVSLFNGMGGACAALIGLMEFGHYQGQAGALLAIVLGLIIGSISFSGSIIAYLKLNGTLDKPLRLPSYNIINAALLIATCAFGAYLIYGGGSTQLAWILFIAACLYGVLFVMPIGGADMPVVISLLNSFTGLAAATGGFLYDNKVMLTGGILVGSAGTLLTLVMCRAMNRPLINVIFGAFGGGSGSGAAAQAVQGAVKDMSAADIAVLMNYSKKVVIVPGYGLAVAQAQHVIHELEELLEDRGVDVRYAIHPVAGRMPGHMNVLLAESNVDYGKLVEMEEINPEFDQTDVVLVVGANDVVNPAAKTDTSSPIYGMPILEVDRARHIIVNKRSMGVGYAGIDNHLFYDPKTSMFFGDARKALTQLVSELKNLD